MALGAKIAVGTIAAGLLAGGIFLFVVSPRQERAKVRGEVAAWGEDFRELEVCILGDRPLSSDATEAVTLRELTVPVGEDYLKECLQLTKDLQRPDGYGSGSMEVETAWFKLKDPVGRLASRMALRTASDEWYRDPDTQRAAIAKGIDELGTAYDALRKAAGMKPAARHGSEAGKLPGLPAGIPIQMTMGVRPMAELQAGVLAVDVGGKILLIRGKQTIDQMPYTTGTIRAAGGAPWGAWVEPNEDDKSASLYAGPVDAVGGRGEPRALVHKLKIRWSEAYGSMTLLRADAAVGDGAIRAVAYTVQTVDDVDWGPPNIAAFLAVSRDGGATWRSSPFEAAGSALSVSQVPARLDLWWEDPELRWLPLSAGMTEVPEARRVPPIGVATQVCRAPKTMWWIHGDNVSVEAGGRLEQLPPEIGSKLSQGILACDDTRAAHLTYAGEYAGRTAKFELCGADGCGMATPIPAWDRSTVVAAFGPNHGFAAAVLADGYLILWHAPDGGGAGLKPRPVYRMPAEFHVLHAIAELDGELQALISNADGLRLVPLPI